MSVLESISQRSAQYNEVLRARDRYYDDLRIRDFDVSQRISGEDRFQTGNGSIEVRQSDDVHPVWANPVVRQPQLTMPFINVHPPLLLPFEQQYQTVDPQMMRYYRLYLWQTRDRFMNWAFDLLQTNGIQVVEYGSQLNHRLGCLSGALKWHFQARNGVEFHMKCVEWAIPDEQLDRASELLSHHGFTELHEEAPCDMGWLTIPQVHALTVENEPTYGYNPDARLYLVPLSATRLTLEDTWEMQASFEPTLSISTPKPPRYILSLVRIILSRGPSEGRHRFEEDLYRAISGLLVDRGFRRARPDTAEHELRKIRAIELMRTWDWGRVSSRILMVVEEAIRNPNLFNSHQECDFEELP